MGQIRKINDLYYIDFMARGLLYSQVAGDNLEGAQQLLHQVEEKIAGGEALTIARTIDLPDFFERFMTEARVLYPASKSLERFAAVIKHFCVFIDDNYPKVSQLDQLTPVIIESYKVYLVNTQKAKIVNLTILLLRDILEFGIKLRFINDNPSLHVRLLAWPCSRGFKATARFNIASQLLSKDVGLAKCTQLLKLSDIARVLYFAKLIPLNREDVYN